MDRCRRRSRRRCARSGRSTPSGSGGCGRRSARAGGYSRRASTVAVMKLDSTLRAYLDEPRFAVLGTLNENGSAHLTVIWYGRRDDEPIVNTTAPRKKAANIARDPRVSLLVGESDRYVRLDGTARIIATGDAALRDIHDLAV